MHLIIDTSVIVDVEEVVVRSGCCDETDKPRKHVCCYRD